MSSAPQVKGNTIYIQKAALDRHNQTVKNPPIVKNNNCASGCVHPPNSHPQNNQSHLNIYKREPTEIDLLKSLKEGYSQLLNELIGIFPREGDLIQLKFFFQNQMPLEEMMGEVIRYVLPHKQQIVDKNEKFFLDNKKLFGELPENKVIHFRTLWLSSEMDMDNKDCVWAFFDVYVRLAENYLILLGRNRKN